MFFKITCTCTNFCTFENAKSFCNDFAFSKSHAHRQKLNILSLLHGNLFQKSSPIGPIRARKQQQTTYLTYHYNQNIKHSENQSQASHRIEILITNTQLINLKEQRNPPKHDLIANIFSGAEEYIGFVNYSSKPYKYVFYNSRVY